MNCLGLGGAIYKEYIINLQGVPINDMFEYFLMYIVVQSLAKKQQFRTQKISNFIGTHCIRLIGPLRVFYKSLEINLN